MKVIKTIGNCCLIFLTVIAMMVTIAFGYYHFFVKDETVGVNNISDQLGIDLIEKAEDLTEEEIDIYLVNPKTPCFIKDKENKYTYMILPVNFTTVS